MLHQIIQNKQFEYNATIIQLLRKDKVQHYINQLKNGFVYSVATRILLILNFGWREDSGWEEE